MKAKTRTKLWLGLTTLTIVGVGSTFGLAVSCAQVTPSSTKNDDYFNDESIPAHIRLIEYINDNIGSVKPINPNVTKAEYDSIDQNNIINKITIPLPSWAKKSDLSVVDFEKKENNTISFRFYSVNRYTYIILLQYNIINTQPEGNKPNDMLTNVTITLDKSQYIEGSQIVATANITPSSLTGVTYTWEILDSSTTITSKSNVVRFNANLLDNNKTLKVTAQYKNQKPVSNTATLTIKAKDIELSSVSLDILELNSDPTKVFFEGDEMTLKANLFPNNIKKQNISYEWVMISKTGERVLGTTNNNIDYFKYRCQSSDNDNSVKVRVTQTINGKQIVKESSPVVLNVQNPSTPTPPDITPEQMQQQETLKWQNAHIPLQTLSAQDIESIRNGTGSPIIESICDSAGLLDSTNFSYDFIDAIVDSNRVSFTVDIYGNTYEELEFNVHDISFEFKLESSSPDDTKLTQAINELNNTNWSDINYDAILKDNLTFHDLSPKGTQNGFILKYINGFNERTFNNKYGTSLSIDENGWKFNVLTQTLSFKITASINGKSQDTNQININYITPQQQLGELDKLPTDSDVALSTSYKGILTIFNPQAKQTTQSLYNSYFDKYFNTASAQVNNNNKWFEMLYQLRFILYQSFADNASSIDYGVIGNQAILKAKVKNDMTISKPYIQLMNDQNVKHSITLKAGEIITLSLSTNDLGFHWNTTNSGDALAGGKMNPYYLGQGPEITTILNGYTTQSLGLSAGTWSLNITNGSGSSIASLNNFSFRNNFTFSLPYYVKS